MDQTAETDTEFVLRVVECLNDADIKELFDNSSTVIKPDTIPCQLNVTFTSENVGEKERGRNSQKASTENYIFLDKVAFEFCDEENAAELLSEREGRETVVRVLKAPILPQPGPLLRRSRKGFYLNDPEKFHENFLLRHFINKQPILPSAFEFQMPIVSETETEIKLQNNSPVIIVEEVVSFDDMFDPLLDEVTKENDDSNFEDDASFISTVLEIEEEQEIDFPWYVKEPEVEIQVQTFGTPRRIKLPEAEIKGKVEISEVDVPWKCKQLEVEIPRKMSQPETDIKMQEVEISEVKRSEVDIPQKIKESETEIKMQEVEALRKAKQLEAETPRKVKQLEVRTSRKSKQLEVGIPLLVKQSEVEMKVPEVEILQKFKQLEIEVEHQEAYNGPPVPDYLLSQGSKLRLNGSGTEIMAQGTEIMAPGTEIMAPGTEVMAPRTRTSGMVDFMRHLSFYGSRNLSNQQSASPHFKGDQCRLSGVRRPGESQLKKEEMEKIRRSNQSTPRSTPTPSATACSKQASPLSLPQEIQKQETDVNKSWRNNRGFSLFMPPPYQMAARQTPPSLSSYVNSTDLTSPKNALREREDAGNEMESRGSLCTENSQKKRSTSKFKKLFGCASKDSNTFERNSESTGRKTSDISGSSRKSSNSKEASKKSNSSTSRRRSSFLGRNSKSAHKTVAENSSSNERNQDVNEWKLQNNQGPMPKFSLPWPRRQSWSVLYNKMLPIQSVDSPPSLEEGIFDSLVNESDGQPPISIGLPRSPEELSILNPIPRIEERLDVAEEINPEMKQELGVSLHELVMINAVCSEDRSCNSFRYIPDTPSLRIRRPSLQPSLPRVPDPWFG